jgi:hypothetical protein
LPLSTAIPPLLADLTDLIGYVAVVVFVVLRLVFTQMSEAKKKAEAPRPGGRPRPPAPQPRPGQPNQRDLRSEVDEFLRRSRGLPEQRPEPELVLAEEPPRRPTSREGWAQQQADPVEQARRESATVSEHVSQRMRHLEESRLAENAAHLGEEVALADDKVQARLDATFKHRLGRIAQQEAAPVAEAAEPREFSIDQIAAMLASPEGIRDAVILNEILTRPADRW